MIETTAAKIGRSMKKCEMRIYDISGRGLAAGLSRPLPRRGPCVAAEAPARPAP